MLLELSIQVSLNGLSFSILDRENNVITFLKHTTFNKKETPFYLLDKLQTLFKTEKELQQDFDKVLVIHENELSTLVPKELFDKNKLADYLKFNAKILQTDFITFDELKVNKSVNVYIPYVNVNNYIYEQFGTFTYKHFTTVLIENILQSETKSEDSKMIVNVESNHFEVLVVKNNQLQLFNTFNYTTKEDFIYYILFTAEQLQLNPETFELTFLGTIKKEDDLYTITYKYIRHISFGNRFDTFSYLNKKPATNYSNYTLLKSF
jgi:PHD/YefM family antitoxin component YafN of YafNO toxin-antitoxin module